MPATISLPELIRRTARECWQDDVFGQAGRMAFYHFLAIFPSLLVFLAIGARIPQLGDHMKYVFQNFSRHILPDQVSQLFTQMTNELDRRSLSGPQLLTIVLGAAWAVLNGTWAMITGLNTAYEVEERRSWRALGITIAGLTLALALTAALALLLILCGARVRQHFTGGEIALQAIEWLVLSAALALSFALLYRFAPAVKVHERWCGPGTFCAVALWIGSTLAARVWFDRVDNYARSYGHLNSVVILLLWLYLTNGAILVGGEMNSEIEKASKARESHRPTA